MTRQQTTVLILIHRVHDREAADKQVLLAVCCTQGVRKVKPAGWHPTKTMPSPSPAD